MGADAKRAGNTRLNRGESALSNTYSEMSESDGKCRKIYVDYPKGKSKPTCLIHVSRHSLDKYKVLGDFSSKYAKTRHVNNLGHNPANRNKYTRQKYNNTIVKTVQLMRSYCKKIIK